VIAATNLKAFKLIPDELFEGDFKDILFVVLKFNLLQRKQYHAEFMAVSPLSARNES
jgi:hypothetical protein